MDHDRDSEVNDDQVFGKSIIDSPEYRRQQQELNRRLLERLNRLELEAHRGPMIDYPLPDPRPFATLFDLVLIGVALYGGFNWPLFAGGWEWFLILGLSPQGWGRISW